MGKICQFMQFVGIVQVALSSILPKPTIALLLEGYERRNVRID